MFQKVLALIDKTDLSTIGLQEVVMLDGCADVVSVTACGTTTIVSDENTYDESALGFIRLRERVGSLNVALLKDRGIRCQTKRNLCRDSVGPTNCRWRA